MDVTPYLSFDVQFDLTGYPKLVLANTSQLPEGVSGEAVWFEVKQPDCISIPVGSAASPVSFPLEVPLRLGSDQKHQCGRYVITMHVLHEEDRAACTRDVELTYREPQLRVEEDFDIFTPRLLYRDRTDYDVSTYDVVESAISWVAKIGPGASIGVLEGAAATFDLKYNGQYYSTEYEIDFARQLTYRHEVYPWLTVREFFSRNIKTRAVEPPTVPQMVEALSQMHQQLVSEGCGCGCDDEGMRRYLYASSLLQHIIAAVGNGQGGSGTTILLNQFITVVNNITQQITNNVLYEFNYTLVGAGGTTTGKVVLDINEECSGFATTGLSGKTVISIDLDGIERRFVEGDVMDEPAPGAFIFVKSTGEWKYGGILYPGQWVKIEYNR